MDPLPTLSSQQPSAPSPNPPSSADTNPFIMIAGHKITTHTIAVVLGILLTVGGPYLVQLFPKVAPAIDAAKQALPTPPVPGCNCPAPPPLSAFEKHLRSSWASEKDDAATRADKLGKLLFLYRRTVFEAETKWSDLSELNQSFHEEASKLGMAGELAITRGVVTAEWTARIPEKAPKPLTEPLRAKISGFLRETIGILERLPP